ncbi:hypothetical protein RHSIM_Rhsim01G0050700 [Rhododendron simsii]|uniref:SAM domain-containing protein n=1 Tax=Rhododendron simsii TaxID=118357 RepID=A0A834M0P0_RHOSS|nr:hypothetical protein RHSIM_Rhsim01G0050700 [Rhododendron simsii]
MDYWFSWLSKTALDRPFVYEYALVFSRNELEEEDVPSFNHELLQSMGIFVAKHRLEILKLAQKEVEKSRPRRISRLVLAINKAKRSITKSFGKWAFPRDSAQGAGLDLTPFRARWTGALRKQNSSKEFNHEKVMATNGRRIMRSGPLDRRLQENLMVTSRCMSVSGPIDGKLQEKLMSINRSPTIGPLDRRLEERLYICNKSPDASWAFDARYSIPSVNGDHCKKKIVGCAEGQSLWSLMFQDMKPT